MRSALFSWGEGADFTKRRLVVRTVITGQPIGPIVKDQAIVLDCLTVEDGKCRFS